jgi:hypothetical protein
MSLEATASVVNVIIWKSPDLICLGDIGIVRRRALTKTRLLMRQQPVSNRCSEWKRIFKETLTLAVKVNTSLLSQDRRCYYCKLQLLTESVELARFRMLPSASKRIQDGLHRFASKPGAHPDFFIGERGEADLEAVYNLYLILKII